MSVSLFSLWLPILLSAMAVFVASWMVNVVIKWHDRDVSGLPDEDKVRDVLRPFALPPGDYVFPYAADVREMGSDEFREKCETGPTGFLTVYPNRVFAMGPALGQWFLVSVAISGLAGFAAGVGLGPGAEFWTIFRTVSVVAFAGYAMGVFQSSIWFGRSWGYSLRSAVDGLIYAWLTAAIFAWLWP